MSERAATLPLTTRRASTTGGTNRETGVEASVPDDGGQAEVVAPGATAARAQVAEQPAPDGVDWRRYRELVTQLLPARATDNKVAWLVYAGIALVALLLRLWNLRWPDTLVFDEAYYVKQAYSMLQYGTEMRVDPAIEKASDAFAHGTHDVFKTDDGDLVMHPPLGKWLIAIPMAVFGVGKAWAWRVATAVAGSVMVLVLGRATRRLLGSTWWGAVAAGLLALEGTHFVESRTGILDVFVALFALAAFACLLIDRDQFRERLAWTSAGGVVESRWARWRLWRWAAGVMLGCCTATKWSGLFFLAAFGLMTVAWDAWARRAAGQPRWWLAGLVRDGLPAFAQLVGTTVVLYVVSWAGWFASGVGYDRHWADANPATGLAAVVPGPIRSLLQYHREIMQISSSLTTSHPSMSPAWQWFLQVKPTLFFEWQLPGGQGGCPKGLAEGCVRTITSLGTVPLWWVAIPALVLLALRWAWLGDSLKAGPIVVGLLAGYFPWFAFAQRTIYAFYTVAFEAFVIMGVVYCLQLLAGRVRGTSRWRAAWGLGIALLAISAAWLAFYHPVYTADLISRSATRLRQWLPAWHR